jgi:tripartite-type tricarboxylate transporter receptor subunit TctC
MACLIRFAFVILAAMTATTAAAAAETYPTRPIRLIVAFPPGGAADLVARLVGQPLSVRLGQPVVIENRPGANGSLAGEVVARATPDGYTLLAGPSALFVINPHLYAKMAFDPLKEFVPIASVQLNTLLLTANPSLGGVKDFRDFIALAAKTKPPLFYASIGNGSEHHLAMELLKRQAGIDLVHVPYKGGGPAALGVIAGDVAAMFGGGSVGPLVQSGKLRGLATTGPRRSASLPDLPAIAEFYPGYEVSLWQGLFAPTGTPPAIVERLRSEVNAVLAQPEYGAKLAAAGAGEPFITTPDEFAARIRSDYEKYGKVIKDIGVKVR